MECIIQLKKTRSYSEDISTEKTVVRVKLKHPRLENINGVKMITVEKQQSLQGYQRRKNCVEVTSRLPRCLCPVTCLRCQRSTTKKGGVPHLTTSSLEVYYQGNGSPILARIGSNSAETGKYP